MVKLKEPLKFITTFEQGVIKQPPYSILILSKYEPSKIVVTVELVRKKRTISQNNYYWGIVLPAIAEKTGYSTPECHAVLKRLHLPPREIKWRGRPLKIANSTTLLSTGEMVEYIERVCAEAAQMGIIVPPADPQLSTRRLDA